LYTSHIFLLSQTPSFISPQYNDDRSSRHLPFLLQTLQMDTFSVYPSVPANTLVCIIVAGVFIYLKVVRDELHKP